MSTEGKAIGWGAIALALITLMGSAQFLNFARWAMGELKLVAGLPLASAVVIATVVGAVMSAFLPHVLPEQWARGRTLRVTRLLASGTAFVMVAAQYPSPIGFQYAAFAAAGAFVVWTVGSNIVYSRFPRLVPESLKGSCPDAYTKGRVDALREVELALDSGEGDALRERIRAELSTAPTRK